MVPIKSAVVSLFCWYTLCVIQSQTREFRLGMLSPFRHIRLGWETNAAAATMAIEKAQSEGLLAGHNITVKWRDDGCNGSSGAGNTVLLRDIDDVDVFIGPPCSSSTTPSGLLASFWNMPMFSQASSDPGLADKTVYKTLVRLGPPFNKMGLALVEIFKYYSWSNVVIVSRRRTDNKKVFCDYSSRAADVIFRENNIVVADMITIDDGMSASEIDDLLKRIKQRGRIVILCSENTIDRRNILIRASQTGMTDGRYVFFLPDHLPPDNVQTPWETGDEFDDAAKAAFVHTFQITVAKLAGPEVQAFRDLIPVKMSEEPWNYNQSLISDKKGSAYSPFLHDTVYLYLLLLHDAISSGNDHRNGTYMFEQAKGKSFKGITGTVQLDSNGDREPDYWVWDLRPGGKAFSVVMEARLTTSQTQKIHFLQDVVWSTADGKPPPDFPVCGFLEELCDEDSSNDTMIIIVSVLVVVVVIVAIVAAVFMYRRSTLERELQQRLWMIPYDAIKLTKSPLTGSFSTISMHTLTSSKCSLNGSAGIGETQVFSTVGFYQGNKVAIKKLECALNPTAMSRTDMMQLKAMRDLHHENVNTFVGLCVESQYPCWITMYCSKGSLQDIVSNDDINLEWLFKMSLLTDLINGMCYIHNSLLRYHGNLKSSNCVVDNRWVLKVTDFGMNILHTTKCKPTTEYKQFQEMFWTAPEMLRNSSTPSVIGQQKADTYSFGIVMYELLYRCEPYNTTLHTPQEIIQFVKRQSSPSFRPDIPEVVGKENVVPDDGVRVMKSSWDENPDARPTFVSLKEEMLKLNNGRKLNIVDNMIIRLEKYANNLEEIVEQRTKDLIEERKKSDRLLYRMLPMSVAEKLKNGSRVMPEIFESVTVYFSDIVGFTDLASKSTPIQVVDLLNDLYSMFDSTISIHDVYKVETIGDAYMVVSGLPDRNGDQHVAEIANMSLDLLKSITTFKVRHCPGYQLKLRIGLHSGSCAAGVVGQTMPRYCLFGDTVNMASRMESNGEALKIHMSKTTSHLLEDIGGYESRIRGEIEIKGKGSQTTFWLLGKKTWSDV